MRRLRLVKAACFVQPDKIFCKIFEKTNKITEYLRFFWAKQKIIPAVQMGLCFLAEVVYNKIAYLESVCPMECIGF